MRRIRVVAVDWSGARDPRRSLWLAEVAGGRVVRLECGWTREQLVDRLLAQAERDPRLVAGFDFAFSLPAWYLERRRIPSAPALWSLLASHSLTERMERQGLAGWLADPEPPFWGRSGRDGSGLTPDREYRRTELDVRRAGFPAQSVFKLVGAGQVGRGSLHGMASLHRLREGGFSVWPFDEARLPLAVEIYPRALFGLVADGGAWLERYAVEAEHRSTATASRDAFDALASALVMDAHAAELVALDRSPGYELESRIWLPGAGASGHRPPSRAELVRRLAEVSHASWRRQSHRDKGIPFEQLPLEAAPHDLERAEDTVRELERLGIVGSERRQSSSR